MKKFLIIFVMILGIASSVFAEERTYRNGEVTAYLSNDRIEIVDNNKNVCVVVTVTPKKNSVGQWVFDFACGNQVSKNINKAVIKATLAGLINSGAAVAGTDGTALTLVATSVAGDFYDWACNQFTD